MLQFVCAWWRALGGEHLEQRERVLRRSRDGRLRARDLERCGRPGRVLVGGRADVEVPCVIRLRVAVVWRDILL